MLRFLSRFLAIGTMVLMMTASAVHAENCDKYKFGTQDWWQCTASQGGGPN